MVFNSALSHKKIHFQSSNDLAISPVVYTIFARRWKALAELVHNIPDFEKLFKHFLEGIFRTDYHVAKLDDDLFGS